MIQGLWPLRGTDPILYTAKAADVIKDKTTGKEYLRGARVVWYENIKIPEPIEKTEPDRWEFIYLERPAGWTYTDTLRELMVKK